MMRLASFFTALLVLSSTCFGTVKFPKYKVSSASNWSSTSTSHTAVTNLSVTIVTTGKPVWVGMIGSTTANSDGVNNYNPTVRCQSKNNQNVLSSFNCEIAFTDGGSNISINNFGQAGLLPSSFYLWIDRPCSSFHTMHFPAAGSHTYAVTGKAGNASNSTYVDVLRVLGCQLVAYEL